MLQPFFCKDDLNMCFPSVPISHLDPCCMSDTPVCKGTMDRKVPVEGPPRFEPGLVCFSQQGRLFYWYDADLSSHCC